MSKRFSTARVALFALAALMLFHSPAGAARRVILMIGDGMGYKHVEAARNYLGRGLAMEQLPTRYGCTTYQWGGSYDSTLAWNSFGYVKGNPTDSAAAATALSTGWKADNAAIAVSHGNGHRLFTLSEYARMNSKSAGVVSTMPFSHATPACFAAHNNHRENYFAIAREMISTYGDGMGARGKTPTMQVIIGGGHPTWSTHYVDGRDYTALKNGATKQGWTLVERTTGVDGSSALLDAAASTDKLFGLFGGSGGYIPLRLADGSGADFENPTLQAMSIAALNVLERDPNGFFVMIEGGAIDSASHQNNMDQMIGEMIGFDEAIEAVVNWVDAKDPDWSDTLLIITADHETGYITRAEGTPANVPLADPGAGLVPTAGMHFAWNSTDHTNSLVPLYAKGAGAEWLDQYADLYDPGFDTLYLDNTAVGQVARQALTQRFHFTAVANQRGYSEYNALLAQMQQNVGGMGAFHVSPGGIDLPFTSRSSIDSRFGTHAIWFPGVGDNEAGHSGSMIWLRNEYNIGNLGRVPLAALTNRDGPVGAAETNYSWDFGNAHFIMLNEYWNGETQEGSDEAAGGDVVPALRDWLAANLAAIDKPVIMVFGHKPAYPFGSFVGECLDKFPDNRGAFWDLLESDPRVKAYICGYTTHYSKYQRVGGRVWQIDLGNAGDYDTDKKTFLDVTVDPNEIRFDVWREDDAGEFAAADTWSVSVSEPAPWDAASPDEAKAASDGCLVRLTATVSAAFEDFFYVQDVQRVGGVRVNKPAFTAVPGSLLTITGTLVTDSSGERSIDAVEITDGSSGNM